MSADLNTDQWLADAQKVFSEKKYTSSFNAAFKDVTLTYKEQISAWWEVQCLDNYIKYSIIRRGLHINLKNLFLQKWKSEATKSSETYESAPRGGTS